MPQLGALQATGKMPVGPTAEMAVLRQRDGYYSIVKISTGESTPLMCCGGNARKLIGRVR